MTQVFQFRSSAYLERLTGRKAYSIDELLKLIRTCPDSAIFYHTFSALRRLRQIRVPYTNDFALWISRELNESALADKLVTIDLVEYDTIKSLRARIEETVEDYRGQNPTAFEKKADDPFYFCDVIRIVYLTDNFAYDLRSFRELLETISVDSLYFHFIESRLQTKLHSDDFSTWVEEGLNLPALAKKIRTIDIHVYTLEAIRIKIREFIDEHLGTESKTH